MPFWIDYHAALSIIQNDIRGRNRHVYIRIQFIRLNIDISKFVVSYCPTDQDVADGGTKAKALKHGDEHRVLTSRNSSASDSLMK